MISGLSEKITIPKVTNGKENTVLKQQNNAMSKLAPPARGQGVTGSGDGDDILGNSIKNVFLKLSSFNSKKDLGTGFLVGFSHQQQKKESLKDL